MVVDRMWYPEPLKWTTIKGSTAQLHAPKKHGDVGYDLEVATNTTVRQDEVVDIPCGVAVQIPDGWFGMVVPRSSATSFGLVIHPGVIDTGYRGPLFARATLLRGEAVIPQGTRMAQLILYPSHTPPLEYMDDLDGSERGETGFGSTGGTR